MKGIKTGGRVLGSQNRLTTDLRSKIQTIIEANIDNVQSDIESLKPIERLQVIEKLISYCVPKLQAQTIDIDMNSLSENQLDEIIQSIQIPELTIKIVEK